MREQYENMSALTTLRPCVWSQDTRAASVRSIARKWPPKGVLGIENKTESIFDMLELVAGGLGFTRSLDAHIYYSDAEAGRPQAIARFDGILKVF
jgi:hypothetical protein